MHFWWLPQNLRPRQILRRRSLRVLMSSLQLNNKTSWSFSGLKKVKHSKRMPSKHPSWIWLWLRKETLWKEYAVNHLYKLMQNTVFSNKSWERTNQLNQLKLTFSVMQPCPTKLAKSKPSLRLSIKLIQTCLRKNRKKSFMDSSQQINLKLSTSSTMLSLLPCMTCTRRVPSSFSSYTLRESCHARVKLTTKWSRNWRHTYQNLT